MRWAGFAQIAIVFRLLCHAALIANTLTTAAVSANELIGEATSRHVIPSELCAFHLVNIALLLCEFDLYSFKGHTLMFIIN